MMQQISCPAVFMRGGTSKGLFFLADDLPADPVERDRFILSAIGSPDPNGRQLDGMGGGISSLSKTMIVSRSSRDGVDVDYLAGQISVDEALIDYAANCGNLSAAVGVFAVESRLVSLPDGEATVRMFNINTNKRVDCTLQISSGHARIAGECVVAGVAGAGAPIRLDFLGPGGAATNVLLPTGNPVDRLDLSDGTSIAASIVDAANLSVFVRAADIGLSGTELPAEIRARTAVMLRLEMIRATAACMAGLVSDPREAARVTPSSPKVAMVSTAADATTISGEVTRASDCDVQVRMISMGTPHLAIPITGAMCTGVAARIQGTLVQECSRPVDDGAVFRVGHGSGALPVAAVVRREGEHWFADRASVFRTARILMRGDVYAAVDSRAAAE